MKFKHLLTATALMLSVCAVAQPPMPKPEEKEGEGFKFTTIKELPVTSVKDQNQAGTCWCYSGLGFIEAELLRIKAVPSVTCFMPSSITASFLMN